jgi:hypothetical protein
MDDLVVCDPAISTTPIKKFRLPSSSDGPYPLDAMVLRLSRTPRVALIAAALGVMGPALLDCTPKPGSVGECGSCERDEDCRKGLECLPFTRTGLGGEKKTFRRCATATTESCKY